MERGYIVYTLCVLLLVISVSAEKIDIQMNNNYHPNEEMKIKVVVYDDSSSLVMGSVYYIIENYYSDVMAEGDVTINEDFIYNIPTDAIIGPWRITVKYNDVEQSRLFNIGKLESALIELEGDNLVVKNIGNVLYEKPILIYIGEEDQTINVKLEVGETKRIRLTAPDGEYTIRVNDGTSENDRVFGGVALTGNVIGLEGASPGNFFKRYPMIGVFFLTLVIFAIIIFGSRYISKKKPVYYAA